MPILWHLFGCVCFTAHEIYAFLLVPPFPRVLAFESLRIHGILCCGLPSRVLSYRCYVNATMQTTNFSPLVIGPNLLNSADWKPLQPHYRNPIEDAFGVAFRKSSTCPCTLISPVNKYGRINLEEQFPGWKSKSVSSGLSQKSQS